jgi:hypothetical protein
MQESLILISVFALAGAAQMTVRCCADAQFRGGRAWWKKASYRAAQRHEYAEYCKAIDASTSFSKEGL